MKITVSLIICILITSGYSYSGSIDTVTYQVNTIGASELQVWIFLNMRDDERISRRNNIQQFNSEYKIEIRNNENDATAGSGIINWNQISPNNKFIIGKFELSKSLIQEIIKPENNYYLFTQSDIKVIINNKNDTSIERNIMISPAELKAATLQKLIFSEEYFNMLLKKYGDASFLYGNFIDAGAEVDTDDSSQSNYVMQFNYTAPLLFSKYLSIAASGRFSTKSNDPLSRFSVFPMYNYLYFNKAVPMQMTLFSGIEGNQNFTTQMFSAGGGVQAIIPNFINFTGGENRIRLKPILKVGMKWLKEYRTEDRSEQLGNDGQIFCELYYYIPVYKSYSILLTGNTFNNFTGNTGGNGWLYQYNLTLGVELPVTGFNVIAKYSQGSNDVNYEYDSQLILGLMMGLFEK